MPCGSAPVFFNQRHGYSEVGQAPRVFKVGSHGGTRTWFLARRRKLSGPMPDPGWQRSARKSFGSMLKAAIPAISNFTEEKP